MKGDIRIVIADDHPIVRQGLRQAIEVAPKLKVVAEAGDGGTALEKIQALKPEVAVLDIDMPVMDGFAVARAMRAQGLSTAIIFLTIHRGEDFFTEAIAVGAGGYVLKDSATTDIVAGITAVAGGQHYTSPAMTTSLFKRATHQATPAVTPLTATERRILELIGEYKTSKEIADELCISHRTVETHRTNICTKLEIHGRHALMKFALAQKSEIHQPPGEKPGGRERPRPT